MVLELLDKSRLLFEEGSVRQVVDVLVYYYNKAKRALESRGYSDIFNEVKALYRNTELVKRYPFLTHLILTDLVNGVDPFALYTKNVTRNRLEPSDCIRALFRDFNYAYFNHPKIDDPGDNLWGYSRKQILDDVLVRGRGDFTKPYGKITDDDKVLLYCYFNLKKHFFTSYAVFQIVLKSLEKIFTSQEYTPVFMDLGCGPMTSGLALADLIHTNTGHGIDFSYIGVDISDAMIKKAQSFCGLDVFGPTATFTFVNNWNQISHTQLNELAGKNNPIIFNASYLFASTSIDSKDLARYVSGVSQNFTNVFFIFQNPNRDDRNVRYEVFKKHIKFTTIVQESENIRYKPASKESNEDVSYEILKL